MAPDKLQVAVLRTFQSRGRLVSVHSSVGVITAFIFCMSTVSRGPFHAFWGGSAITVQPNPSSGFKLVHGSTVPAQFSWLCVAPSLKLAPACFHGRLISSFERTPSPPEYSPVSQLLCSRAPLNVTNSVTHASPLRPQPPPCYSIACENNPARRLISMSNHSLVSYVPTMPPPAHRAQQS